MSEDYAIDREYRNIPYRGSIHSVDIGGFSYETGRDFEQAAISEKAVVPGDMVWVTKDGREWVYRVVEVSEERILAYDLEDDSMNLELLEWDGINSKVDPHSDFINCHDRKPDEIKQVREVSEDE